MAVTRPFLLVQKNSPEGGWRAGLELAISVSQTRDPAACTTALTSALASRRPHDRPQYVLGMAVTYVFAGIPVAHCDVAPGWYERLIGRPPDLVPNDDEAAWRLTDTGWITSSLTQLALVRR